MSKDTDAIYQMYVAGGAKYGDRWTLVLFRDEMEKKLAIARDKGRRGWFEMDVADLENMLHKHIEKGDMRDVANIAMFIHYRKEWEAK
jgi:hypothetical protein